MKKLYHCLKEGSLIEYLIKNKEQNLRRSLILSYVWGADAEVEEETWTTIFIF